MQNLHYGWSNFVLRVQPMRFVSCFCWVFLKLLVAKALTLFLFQFLDGSIVEYELRNDLKELFPWIEYIVRCGWMPDGKQLSVIHGISFWLFLFTPVEFHKSSHQHFFYDTYALI